MNTTTYTEINRRGSVHARYPGDLNNVDSLLLELDRYRQQSESLQRINDLHARLACALELPSVIETFSVWLTPFVSHDLIAYRNLPRRRSHGVTSSHGPERRGVMATARAFLERNPDLTEHVSCSDSAIFEIWPLGPSGGEGELLLVRASGPFNTEENTLIAEAGKILYEALHRALDYEDLFEQARRDTLTGLCNRRVFEERVHMLVETARRHNRPLTLASMDLDHFKLVNDTWGHSEGDLVLKKVAETLQSLVRSTDLLVRTGGDEFMLLLPDTKLRAGRKLANRLKMSVEELDIRTPARNKLGISIGLAQWKANLSTEDWIKRADEGLYKAKTSGRSKVCSIHSCR